MKYQCLFWVILGLQVFGSSLLSCMAQSQWFRQYTSKDGLSNNHVNCSIQDKKGFIWFGTLDGLNRFDGYNFKVFKTGNDYANPIGNNFVSTLYLDENGLIWAGTHNGLWKYDSATEKFELLDFTYTEWIYDITGDKNGNLWFIALGKLIQYNTRTGQYRVLEDKNCASLHIDKQERLWCTTEEGLLICHDFKKASRNVYDVFKDRENIKNIQLTRMLDMGSGTFLVGTKNHGLLLFKQTENKTIPIRTDDAKYRGVEITDIISAKNNEYWVSTNIGLYIFYADTHQIQHVIRQENEINGLSDNFLQGMYSDNDGGIWLCNRYEGVSYFHPDNNLFQQVFIAKSPFTQLIAGDMHEDPQGNLWVAAENNGLFKLAKQTSELLPIFPHVNDVSSVMVDGEDLWIGKDKNGIEILDKNTGIRKHSYRDLTKKTDENSRMRIQSIDKIGQKILIGTSEGAYLYDRRVKQFQLLDGLQKVSVSSILEDPAGGIWATSYYSGLFFIDPADWRVSKIDMDFSDDGRYNNTVTSIYQDRQQQLWLSTEGGGICRYNPADGNYRFYTTADGLSSNTTFKILDGGGNSIWITTASGICHMDIQTESIVVYTDLNGLPFDQYNYNSGIVMADSSIYFGATGGLVKLNGHLDFEHQTVDAPLYITGLQVDNRELLIDSGDISLQQSTLDTRMIRLPYDKSSVSIDIAALYFRSPNVIQYRYKIGDMDEPWTDMQTNRKIYLPKLPPGKYTFRAQAALKHGVWGKEHVLHITVAPPWWKSTWALFGYIVLGIALLYYVLLWYTQKLRDKHLRLLEVLKHEQDKEMYRAKIDFFTEVAHEVRTPLTLIVAPIEKIAQATEMNEVKENIGFLQKNVNRLMVLTNQLLDFRRIERNELALNFVKTSLYDILTEIYLQFKLTAETKGLDFQLAIRTGDVEAYIDKEAFHKILDNLIHNALKYADSKVVVILDAYDSRHFTVIIRNNGDPIPKSHHEKLFEPFYRRGQEKQGGTGIGLAIARGLARQHHGELVLKDRADWIDFMLTLPVYQEGGFDFRKPIDSVIAPMSGTASDDTPKTANILVVEDHVDIRELLQRELSGHYQVYLAKNGEEALAILQRDDIDLVLSDVKMPGMDGFELCKQIKTDIDLSHIPVILLTAKTQMDDKVAGLTLGADVYMEKPFSPAHVKAQIASLLENRKHLVEKFASSIQTPIGSMAQSKTDDVFLEKLNKLILDNLDNIDLDVSYLADELCMSRRNLYRKIKAVAGISPAEMIKIIRLKKGADLLQTTDLKIYEIALQTGFNSPDTFTRNFTKQFGLSPTDFLKKAFN